MDACRLVNYAITLSVELGRTAEPGIISGLNLLGMYLQFNPDRQEVLDAYRIG